MSATITAVSDEQITLFLKWLIELTPATYVDGDGYVRRKEDGECICLSTGDTKVLRPLIIYSTNISDPDALILNPFAEGLAKSTARTWFYNQLTMVFSNYVRMVQKFILYKAIDANDKNSKDIEDMELASIISPWVQVTDEKLLTEFESIVKSLRDYIAIHYLAKQRETRMSVCFTSDTFKKGHPKLRQKSWKILQELLYTILDIKDTAEFNTSSKNMSCPELDATLKILYKGYAAINKYLKFIAQENITDIQFDCIDLEYFATNIELLEDYRLRAKHLISASNVKSNTPIHVASPIPSVFNQNPILPASGVLGSSVPRPYGISTPPIAILPPSVGVPSLFGMGPQIPTMNGLQLNNGLSLGMRAPMMDISVRGNQSNRIDYANNVNRGPLG